MSPPPPKFSRLWYILWLIFKKLSVSESVWSQMVRWTISWKWFKKHSSPNLSIREFL
jgi:hypothetical protein